MTKRLLRYATSHELDDLLQISAAYQGMLHQTEDHSEAVNAFLEKRPGRFTGR